MKKRKEIDNIKNITQILEFRINRSDMYIKSDLQELYEYICYTTKKKDIKKVKKNV